MTPEIELRVRNTAGAEFQVETYIAEMDPGNTENPRLTGNEGWNSHQLYRNETQMWAASRTYESDRYAENEDGSGNGLLEITRRPKCDAIGRPATPGARVGTDDAYVAPYTHEAARVAGPKTYDTTNGPNQIAVVVDNLESTERRIRGEGIETFNHQDYEPARRSACSNSALETFSSAASSTRLNRP